MIEVTECAPVDKAVLQKFCEEIEAKPVTTRDVIIVAEAAGAKRTLQKPGLWEAPRQKETP